MFQTQTYLHLILHMKQQLLDEVHKTTQAHDAAQKAFAEAEKVFFSTTWKLKSLFRSSAEKLAMLKQQFPSLHRGVWAFLAEQKGYELQMCLGLEPCNAKSD